MKKCCKCDEIKDSSNFSKSVKRKDGLQSYCKTCSNELRMTYFFDNRENERKVREIYFSTKRKFVDEFKESCKCQKCGDSRWYVLDFHHLDKTLKEFSISTAMNCSIKTLKKEIDKCIVLCSNCHRELHFLEKEEK